MPGFQSGSRNIDICFVPAKSVWRNVSMVRPIHASCKILLEHRLTG